MKRMQRYKVLDYGFNDIPVDDDRLTLEGKTYNDYVFGTGRSRKDALGLAIVLLADQNVQASGKLAKEWSKASTEENGCNSYNLAIRFFYDKASEVAKATANLSKLIEERRIRIQGQTALEAENEFLESTQPMR